MQRKRKKSTMKQPRSGSMNALTSVLPPSNVVVLFERLSPSGLGWPLRIIHAPNLPLPALRGAAGAHGLAPNDELFSHARCGEDPRRWKIFCADGQSSNEKRGKKRKDIHWRFSGLVYLCGRLSHRTTFLYCFLDHSVPPPRHHTSGTPGNVFFLSDTQRLLATLPNAPEVYFTAYAPLSCESVTFEAPPALLLESPLDPPSSSSIRSAAAAPSLSMSKPVR